MDSEPRSLLPCRFTHSPPPCRVTEDPAQGIREKVGPAGRDDESVDAVVDCFADASGIRCDDGQSGDHRLHHRDRIALVERRHGEDVHPGQQTVNVGSIPEELELVGEAELVTLGTDLLLERALPGGEEGNVEPFVDNRPRRGQAGRGSPSASAGWQR